MMFARARLLLSRGNFFFLHFLSTINKNCPSFFDTIMFLYYVDIMLLDEFVRACTRVCISCLYSCICAVYTCVYCLRIKNI